ncbi:MAG: hypothetical protein Q4G07_11885, partial [Oscillospiraceae bacterium]|nr:hypothetical protein [Oscillospiraceae bacterium]
NISEDDIKEAEQAVQEDLLRMSNEKYTLSFSIKEVLYSETATKNVQNFYATGFLAQEYTQNNASLKENLIAIYVNYECEYDHTLTPNEDGDIQCYIFVLRDLSTGKWNVWDRSYDLKKFGKSGSSDK